MVSEIWAWIINFVARKGDWPDKFLRFWKYIQVGQFLDDLGVHIIIKKERDKRETKERGVHWSVQEKREKKSLTQSKYWYHIRGEKSAASDESVLIFLHWW